MNLVGTRGASSVPDCPPCPCSLARSQCRPHPGERGSRFAFALGFKAWFREIFGEKARGKNGPLEGTFAILEKENGAYYFT